VDGIPALLASRRVVDEGGSYNLVPFSMIFLFFDFIRNFFIRKEGGRKEGGGRRAGQKMG
jgi:hypothetical protein